MKYQVSVELKQTYLNYQYQYLGSLQARANWQYRNGAEHSLVVNIDIQAKITKYSKSLVYNFNYDQKTEIHS